MGMPKKFLVAFHAVDHQALEDFLEQVAKILTEIVSAAEVDRG